MLRIAVVALATAGFSATLAPAARPAADPAIAMAESLVARMTAEEKLPQLLNVAPAIPRRFRNESTSSDRVTATSQSRDESGIAYCQITTFFPCIFFIK